MNKPEIGQIVYAKRDLYIHEIYAPALGENYVVVNQDDPGEVTDLSDDGRVYVLFDEDEWHCELGMLTDQPSIRKHYSTGMLIDQVTVYYLDSKEEVIGELYFKWFMGELRLTAHLPSFNALRLADGVFERCAEHKDISPDEFVRILQGLGYTDVVAFEDNVWAVDPAWLKPVFEVGNTVYAAQNITFGDLFDEPKEHNIFVEIGTPGIIDNIDDRGRVLVLFENEDVTFDVRGLISITKPTDLSRVSHSYDELGGGIYIYDRDGTEIVMWDYAEFDDPEAVHAALAAVDLFYQHGPDALKQLLGKS